MALSKLKYNSLNVTAAASKAVGFDAGADDLSASLSGGSMVFIKKVTASSSGTISFLNGASDVVLDSTYKEYLFTFKNIHPSTETSFTFQADTGTNTNYNQTIQSTYFRATHREDAGEADLYYNQSNDQANGTAFQTLVESPQIGANNDENLNGYLHIFNPSSSVFTKHFIARISTQNDDGQPGYVMQVFTAGYFNTATALTRFQFKMGSGNIDAGDICLYKIS
jgi:hypothetical protein